MLTLKERGNKTMKSGTTRSERFTARRRRSRQPDVRHAARLARPAWSLLLRSIVVALLGAFAITAQPPRAVPVAAQETTEQVVQTEQTVCEEAPAAAGLGEAISGAASAQANILNALGGPSSLPGLPDLPPLGQRPIMPYWQAQEISKGTKGAWQAHHLLEQRHIKNWGQAAGKTLVEIEKDLANAPAVILDNQLEHIPGHQEINKLIPCDGSKYSKMAVWEAYQQVYKFYPEWLKALEPYFG
jgi:hypothetical protein